MILEESGYSLPSSYLKKVDGPVWELRPEFGGTEYRVFFGSIARDTFGIVLAGQKTWDKVPEAMKQDAARKIEEMQEAQSG